jgi:hypothetical protein
MQKSLKKFAQQLENNPLCRQGFFLAAALISILFTGYYFGTFDQSAHIPFLKAWADPSLYPNDPFIALRKDQFSFFWYFFVPFLKLGILEPAMFFTHLLATTLFFTAVWDLGMTLFGEPLVALFGVMSFIFPHTGFVGFPVIEFSLLSRTFVLPFLIFAVNNFLRKREGFAYLILGVIYNLNLLMTNFVLITLVTCCLVDIRKIGWRKLAFCIVLFFVGAIPVLIWKIQSGTGLNPGVRPEWFSTITRGGLFQIFYIFSNTPFMLLSLGGISSIAMFIVALRYDHTKEHDFQMTYLMAGLILIMVFQVITTLWLPLTSVIQMQFSRASLFILIFAYIYFAGYIVKEYTAGKIAGGNLILIAGCFFLSVSPAIPLIAWLIYRIYPSIFENRKIAAGVILVIMMGIYFKVFAALNIWKPGIHVYSKPSAWIDVQNWARNNTTKEAMFITPPQEVGLYQPDWRVLSERGTIASFYDIFEIALKPDYLPIWKPRFENLAPGALGEFGGNFFENLLITRKAFNSLDKNQFLKIACQYGASYLVVEKENEIELPSVYENTQFKVYVMKDEKCSG